MDVGWIWFHAYGASFPLLLRRNSRMFFVVPAEETCVGEVVIPCYLLDAL